MSTYIPAVMGQVDFACSVLGFIKRLLRVVLPALARDRSILGTKEQFRKQLDAQRDGRKKKALPTERGKTSTPNTHAKKCGIICRMKGKVG